MKGAVLLALGFYSRWKQIGFHQIVLVVVIDLFIFLHLVKQGSFLALVCLDKLKAL